jgi:hypothetical protein
MDLRPAVQSRSRPRPYRVPGRPVSGRRASVEMTFLAGQSSRRWDSPTGGEMRNFLRLRVKRRARRRGPGPRLRLRVKR